jgi:hypothetical protein
MTYTVQIESVLNVPASAMLHALAEGGVEGTVLETDPILSMAVPADDAGALSVRVQHALETLIASRRLSLIPERIGEAAFVLRPPAA